MPTQAGQPGHSRTPDMPDRSHHTNLSALQVVANADDGARASASRHGAQVLEWHAAGRDRLYLSPNARFLPDEAIRGGVPVIFPRFSDRGDGRRHGFARVREWQALPSGPDELRFGLRDDADTREDWPHAFRAELFARLGSRSLSISLQVENTGTRPCAFTCALHTYLLADGIADVRLAGLERYPYRDATRNLCLQPPEDVPPVIEGEIDRIYPDVATPLELVEDRYRIRIEQSGFTDVVLWNPGAALSAGMADLGPGQHRHFVCVEAARILTPIELGSGAIWTGSQSLHVVDSDGRQASNSTCAYGATLG